MKLQQMSSSVDVSTNMQMTSIKAELAQYKLHKMWDLLQSPYRDPIASLIREYVSNCFDSHIEAKVDTPVYVTLEEDHSGWYWACEDFGVGISEERAANIFMKYLTSTKEETNDQIGAFGMGSKSGLGYTDLVHIRTRFDGTEYTYMLHKTTDAPTLSLVNKTETDKRNGTQVKVYLKDNWDEKDRFIDKTKQQLEYFDNVSYGGRLKHLNEDFKVYKGNNFVWKPNAEHGSMMLLIVKVVYPINWEAIGKTNIRIPISLTFDIGDLPVIFTREDIRYTDEAVQKINDKIQQATRELVKLATPAASTEDLQVYATAVSGKCKVVFSPKDHLDISNLGVTIDFSKVRYLPNPDLNPACLRDGLNQFLKYAVVSYRRLANGRNLKYEGYGSDWKYKHSFVVPEHGNWTFDRINGKRIFMDDDSDPRKNRWIQQDIGGDNPLLRDNRDNLKLQDYKVILKLNAKNKDTWRKQIAWYQDMLDKYFENFFDYKYSEIEVPDEFEKKAKASINRTLVGTDEIRYRKYRQTENHYYDGRLSITGDLNISTIESLKGEKVIWGLRSEEDALKCTLRLLFNICKFYSVISVAKRDAEIMEIMSEECENVINISDWYIDDNLVLETLVFFERYRTLVSCYNSTEAYVKPTKVPYVDMYKYLPDYKRELPTEFINHLVKIFYLQGKSLNLEQLPALESHVKAETKVNKIDEMLGYVNKRDILAFLAAPNRPLAEKCLRDKLLLINNL